MGEELNDIPDRLKNDIPIGQQSANLEWWYVQGSFLWNNDSYHFMIAVFRSSTPDQDTTSDNALICLSSVLNETRKTIVKKSVYNQKFFDRFLLKQDKIEKTNLDNDFLDAVYEQVKSYGPPAGLSLDNKLELFYENEIIFNSEAHSIKFSNDQIIIDLSLDDHQKILFTLKQKTYFYKLPEEQESKFYREMKYLFCPSLDLILNENSTIAGNAWIDHQWGNHGWIIKKTKNSLILGWDWFGISLNNGLKLLLIQHKNMESGESVNTKLLVIQNETMKVITNFKLEIINHWESKQTSVNYPIHSKIVIPSLRAELTFKPFLEDQEIPFLGPMRAIWQGAGKIFGTIENMEVKGTGRCELHGYGYIFDLKKELDDQRKRIDQVISQFFPVRFGKNDIIRITDSENLNIEADSINEFIADPVWELFQRGGKRWRSILYKLLLQALGVDSGPYEKMLYCLTEMNHTGSLIIDDIQDNSAIRRGAKSIHLKYGLNNSINTANLLYFLPSKLIYENDFLSQEQKYEILNLLNKAHIDAHLGQNIDLHFAQNPDKGKWSFWQQNGLRDKILSAYSLKTALILSYLAKIACKIAKSDVEQTKILSNWSHQLGLAFQIIDDINNFNGSEKWNKSCGEDLLEGKVSYVIFRCLHVIDKKDRDFILSFYKKGNIDKKLCLLDKGVEIISQSGILKTCRFEVKQRMELEWLKISEILPQTDQKIMMYALSQYLMYLYEDN